MQKQKEFLKFFQKSRYNIDESYQGIKRSMLLLIHFLAPYSNYLLFLVLHLALSYQ